MKILRRRGRPGKPLRPAPASALHPCAREGGALSEHYANKEAEGLLPLFLRRYGHEHRENPASEEAGCVDPLGSVAVAAGPDQRVAVIALPLHQ
jgi:hypothetical protein